MIGGPDGAQKNAESRRAETGPDAMAADVRGHDHAPHDFLHHSVLNCHGEPDQVPGNAGSIQQRLQWRKLHHIRHAWRGRRGGPSRPDAGPESGKQPGREERRDRRPVNDSQPGPVLPAEPREGGEGEGDPRSGSSK